MHINKDHKIYLYITNLLTHEIYQLVRFNPPKDKRTGPTRQHLVSHHGNLWEVSDDKFKCKYDPLGAKLTPQLMIIIF